jgi:nucleotide-binding universal stress UspA family protein
VLPLARRLAEAHDAELILAHVVPAPELTEVGPLDAEDLELRERLLRRNERVAGEYLDRLRARLAETGARVRSLVLRGGDARSRLARAIEREGVDLVVLSAQGHSARADVPLGNVTAYLVAHAVAPLLIVRRAAAVAKHRAPRAAREDVRLPSQATP